MSAVDCPLTLPLSDRAAGEFVARAGSKRLAVWVFGYVAALGSATVLLALRRFYIPMVETLFLVVLICGSVAAVGLAVRTARLQIDADGIRWGWGFFGFRIQAQHLGQVIIYDDAVAIPPRRGSTWYVSHRDWEDFDDVPAALAEAGHRFDIRKRRAPLKARLQSYGVILNGMLILVAAAVTVALAIATLTVLNS